MSRKLALIRAASTVSNSQYSSSGRRRKSKPVTLATLKPPARRAQPEAAIHRAVVEQLRARAWPDVLWWHTPNGGIRTKRSGAALKAMGMLPGVSDILAVRKGNIYAMELKAPGGRPTEHQQDFQWKLSAAGGFCCVCDELDRAIAVLESWKLLRGHS